MGTQKVKAYEEPKEEKATEPSKIEVAEENKQKEKEKHITEGPKIRGKKWNEISEKMEPNVYSATDALEFLKQNQKTKFESSVEVHIKLNPKKGQTIRGTLNLPHGTGKEKKVVVFNADILSQIEKGKIDFEVLVAKPEDMPALAKVAKILGPRGLMPNPKSGTISEKPEEAVKKIQSGQIEYKADVQNNLHQMIGKASWETKKLEENLKTVIDSVRQYNPVSVTICTTMSPGIRVEI